MSDHAKYPPSSAKRLVECPGSIELSAKCPEPPEGEAAKEGTATHGCLEIYLKNGDGKLLTTTGFLREQGHPAQRIVLAEQAARAIWRMRPKGATLQAETKISLAHIDKDMWGTADAIIMEDFGRLHVIDYKNGRMPVEHVENPQLIAYGIGAAHPHDYNFSDVVLTVIQPRAVHAQGVVRSWQTSIDVLHQWSDRFKHAIQLSKKKSAPFKSGEWCFYCPAKGVCKTYVPESEGERRSRFITQKSPEQIRKQLLLDFGPAIGRNEDDTAKTGRQRRTTR